MADFCLWIICVGLDRLDDMALAHIFFRVKVLAGLAAIHVFEAVLQKFCIVIIPYLNMLVNGRLELIAK